MQLRARHYFIIVLVIFTSVLHLAAAFDTRLFHDGSPVPDPLFTLNGLGYLGLLGAYFLPIKFFQNRRNTILWALFIFTSITIFAWIVIWIGFSVIRDGMPFFSLDSLYGVPSKIAEIVLLFLFWRDRS